LAQNAWANGLRDMKTNLENPFYHVQEQWFALRVRSRYEKLVATMANSMGFEDFLPVYQSHRRWSDRVKLVELPLFPGYVFCRLNAEHRLPLLTIPGVLHFVGIGRVPVPIADAEIAAIQKALQSGVSAEPWPFLEAGHRVRLEAGPLAGLEGILVESPKKDRVVVSVTLLNRSVAVGIERHWVRPLDISSGPQWTIPDQTPTDRNIFPYVNSNRSRGDSRGRWSAAPPLESAVTQAIGKRRRVTFC
jgi:transcription antitermination factor NusG